MEIIETSVFSKQIQGLISDDEYAELQFALAQRPDLGSVIPGGGGIRKVRWGQSGRGKRGGIRVVYYWYVSGDQILMLLAYAKSVRDNLTPEQTKALKQLVKEEFSRG